jgi:1,2-phenylacetyl-CoA epoxidase catalytic subunit
MPELAIDTRTVGGAFSVDECARRIIHYRFAENVCMTTAGGWASSAPTIKVKFALGEHCYHDSIHSFWLGQRLPELRVTRDMDQETPPTLRTSYVAEPPNEEFLKFCEAMQLQTDELLRLTGLYRVLKTHLAVYYRHHIAVTDPVCDAPTVRILNHILLEEEEHLKWGQAIYEEMAGTPARRREALQWQMELEALLAASGGVTGGR